jgi:predicted amidohydrolase YtcJ
MKRTWTVLLAVLLAMTAGCTYVRNFLIPPPSSSAGFESSSASAGPSAPTRGPAERLLLLGQVYGQPGATAIAIRDGKIRYVGPQAGVQAHIGPSTQTERQLDAIALPPLRDSHVRLTEQLQVMDGVDCSRVTSLAQLQTRLSTASDGLAPGDWLWVHSVPAGLWAELTHHKINQIADFRPMVLVHTDGNQGWLSPAAAQLLPKSWQMAPNTAVPLTDGAWLRQVRAALPAQRVERQKPLLVQALTAARQQGWSELDAVDCSLATATALVQLAGEGRLPLTVRVWLTVHDGQWADLVTTPQWVALLRRRYQIGEVQLAGIAAELPALPLAGAPTATAADHLAWAQAGGLSLLLHADQPEALQAAIAAVVQARSTQPNGIAIRLDSPFAVAESVLLPLRGLGVQCGLQPPERPATALSIDRVRALCPVVLGSGLPVGMAAPADVVAAAGGEMVDLLWSGLQQQPPLEPAAAFSPGMPADFVVWKAKAAGAQQPVLSVVAGQVLVL